MTRSVIARVAGATVLLYRALGVAAFFLYEGSLGRGTAADRVAAVAAHASDLRIAGVLTLANALCALIVGVAMYFYTRDGGVELATLGLIGRTAEAALYGVFALCHVALVSIATSSTEASTVVDARLVREIGLSAHRVTMAACFFFAAANAAFAWLLLRARFAPRFVALIGLVGALVPLAGMPLQMIDATRGFFTPLLWVTMFLFELLFAFWLLATGGRDAVRP
jgi:hypothetical protein